MSAFACPPDCGHCCTHLQRAPSADDARFRDALRDEGIYGCADGLGDGLSIAHDEAQRLVLIARERGLRVDLHPRTFLLETRRRLAVVLDWHVAHASCPFYADHKCTVYEHRPLVCRAYPVLVGGRSRLLAPECPKMPFPASGLRAESRARAAVDRAHLALDERAHEALARGRFVRGLAAREATERAKRYRALGLDEFLAHSSGIERRRG